MFLLTGVPLIRHAWLGFNVSIFAYGQTGSGKSYSMMGSGGDPGLIPRVCDSLFDFIDNRKPPNVLRIEASASYLEIYNEKIQDLLSPQDKPLKAREHKVKGVYVEGLSQHVVLNFSDVEGLMELGLKVRTLSPLRVLL